MSSATQRTPVHGRHAARRRATWRPGPIPERVTLRRSSLYVGGVSVAVITISGWLSYLIAR